MGIAEAIAAFFSFAEAFLDKMPDWLQRRKKEYLELLEKYNEEWNKPTSERDGNKADQLRIDLETFEKVFWKELQENSVSKKAQ